MPPAKQSGPLKYCAHQAGSAGAGGGDGATQSYVVAGCALACAAVFPHQPLASLQYTAPGFTAQLQMAPPNNGPHLLAAVCSRRPAEVLAEELMAKMKLAKMPMSSQGRKRMAHDDGRSTPAGFGLMPRAQFTRSQPREQGGKHGAETAITALYQRSNISQVHLGRQVPSPCCARRASPVAPVARHLADTRVARLG